MVTIESSPATKDKNCTKFGASFFQCDKKRGLKEAKESVDSGIGEYTFIKNSFDENKQQSSNRTFFWYFFFICCGVKETPIECEVFKNVGSRDSLENEQDDDSFENEQDCCASYDNLSDLSSIIKIEGPERGKHASYVDLKNLAGSSEKTDFLFQNTESKRAWKKNFRISALSFFNRFGEVKCLLPFYLYKFIFCYFCKIYIRFIL